MHADCNYTFHGDAPIAGLTPHEVDLLTLGHVVHQEAKREDVDQVGGSNGNSNMARRKRELQAGQQRAREDMYRDLGIQ